MFLYINYPSWLHPQIFPDVRFLSLLRWYGLMYAFAFECLGVKSLVSSVIPDNRKVLHFHKLLGARPITTPERYAQKEADSGVCQRWFEFTEHDWPAMKAEWEPILNEF